MLGIHVLHRGHVPASPSQAGVMVTIFQEVLLDSQEMFPPSPSQLLNTSPIFIGPVSIDQMINTE